MAPDRTLPSGQKKKYYKCRCTNCGNIVEINAYKVRNNNYKNCRYCKPSQKEIDLLVGKRFGKLTVVSRSENHIQPNGSTKVMWKCKCDCGNSIIVQDYHLKTGHTTSCGCYHAEHMRELLIRDLQGQKFGKLTPIRRAYIRKNRQYWECKCECGNKCIANSASLTSGRRKSCGCLVSVAEYEFEQYLIQNGYSYVKQYKFEECKDVRALPFDFAIFHENKLLLLVELNGEQHYHPFTYCNEAKDIKKENLKNRIKKDNIKKNFCIQHNIPLLVIRYTKFYKKELIFEEFVKTLKEEW